VRERGIMGDESGDDTMILRYKSIMRREREREP